MGADINRKLAIFFRSTSLISNCFQQSLDDYPTPKKLLEWSKHFIECNQTHFEAQWFCKTPCTGEYLVHKPGSIGKSDTERSVAKRFQKNIFLEKKNLKSFQLWETVRSLALPHAPTALPQHPTHPKNQTWDLKILKTFPDWITASRDTSFKRGSKIMPEDEIRAAPIYFTL